MTHMIELMGLRNIDHTTARAILGVLAAFGMSGATLIVLHFKTRR